MSGIGDLVAKMSVDSEGFSSGLERGEHALHHFGEKFAEVGAIIGVGFSLERVAEGIKGSIESTVELAHAAEKLDTSIGFFQALRHEATMNHVEFGALETGITKMTRTLGEVAGGEGKDAAAALGMMHIKIGNIVDLNAGQQFRVIAQGIAGLGNTTDRTNAAMSIFGRGGAELLNVLGQGAKGLDEAAGYLDRMGLSIGNLEAEKLVSADLAMKELGESVEGLYRNIAVDLAPTIKDATNALSDFIAKTAKGNKDTGFLETVVELGKGGWNIAKGGAGGLTMGAGGLTGIKELESAGKKQLGEASDSFGGIVDWFIWGKGGKPGLSPGDEVTHIAEKAGAAMAEAGEKSKASLAAAAIEAERLKNDFDEMQAHVDQLGESFRTPLEHARENFDQLWEAAQQGADVAEASIVSALGKIREEEEKLARRQYELHQRPIDEWHKKLDGIAEGIHNDMETPLEKLRKRMEELKGLHDSKRLSDVDFNRAVKKAQDEYNESKPKPPDASHQEAMTADSGEFQQMMAELARAGGFAKDDAAKETAEATKQMAALFPVLIQQTDPRNGHVKNTTINLSGSQMDALGA